MENARTDNAPQFKKLRIPKLHKDYGMKQEAKIFYEGPANEDYENSTNWVEYVPSLLPAFTRQRFDSCAIQIYKKVDGTKTVNGVPSYKTAFIKVQSPIILEHLRTIMVEDPSVEFREKSVEIYHPFQSLCFAWDKIMAHRLSIQDDPEEGGHFAVLCQFMENELSEMLANVRNLRSQGRMSYDLLWALYPRGSYILSTQMGYQQVYRVLSFARHSSEYESLRDPTKTWSLRCEFVQFDGYEYGYSETTLSIPFFYDTKYIANLIACPWSFVQDHEDLRTKLIQRGRNVLDYQGYQYKFYDGVALLPEAAPFSNHDDDAVFTSSKFNIVGRIIVDPYLYARTNEHLRRQIRAPREPQKSAADMKSTRSRTDPTDSGSGKESKRIIRMADRFRPDEEKQAVNRREVEKDEERLLLMSPLLDGFSLNEKRWANFLVDFVSPLVLDDGAFEDLVLPPEQKELILAFALQQNQKVQEVDDMISGKGQGLLVLLSGPPGTGKTLTAEAVADKVGRPLYHVDTHELSSKMDMLSLSLRRIMSMAAEWNAIVLLDEADVFLQRRQVQNFSMNERVAVFLRELEYYRGTMFLTTNLLDDIDEAVESRIHAHIIFQKLDFLSRSAIWSNFLRRTPSYADANNEKDIHALAKWTMNGRQIKNAVQMTAKWCSRQPQRIDLKTIENIIRLTCPKALKEERCPGIASQNGCLGPALQNGYPGTASQKGESLQRLDFEPLA